MNQTETPKIRMALWFSLCGDLKFLSHRDTLRLWQRALARAAIAVSYSHGFNPHPRINLPLPRSVGMSALAELLLFELERPCSPDRLERDLEEQLPREISIVAVRAISARLSAQPAWAQYRLALGPGVDRTALAHRLQRFWRMEQCVITRPARPRHPQRTVDLRAGISQIELDGPDVVCTVKIADRGTARMDEILPLLGLDSPQQVTDITRVAVGYSAELQPPN